MIITEVSLPFKFHGHNLKLVMYYDPEKMSVFSYVPLPSMRAGVSKLLNYLSKQEGIHVSSLAFIKIAYDKTAKHVHLATFYVKTQLEGVHATPDEVRSLRGLGKTILCNSFMMLDMHADPVKMPRNNLRVRIEAGGSRYPRTLDKYKGVLPTREQILEDSHDIMQTLHIALSDVSSMRDLRSLVLRLLGSMTETYETHDMLGALEDIEDCVSVLYNVIDNFKLMRYYERMYSFKPVGKITNGEHIPMEASYQKLIHTCKLKAQQHQ